MKNPTIDQDNRKALPRYLLRLLAAGIIGGIGGFAVAWFKYDHLAQNAGTMLSQWITAAAPWLLAVTSAAALAVVFLLYRRAKTLFTHWDGEDGAVMDQADHTLTWALLVTSVQMVLDLFLFLAAQSGNNSPVLLTGLAIFLLSIFLLIFAQQKIVDLTRQMNPEKQGSVYDAKFQKKWLASCDEAERSRIGQASYRAFRTVNVLCPILWLVLFFLHISSEPVLLPAFLVCFIWAALNVSYSLDCLRPSKRN